jgi:hypothetical protein
MRVPDHARLDGSEHADGTGGVALLLQDALGDRPLVDRTEGQVLEVHSLRDGRLDGRPAHQLGPGFRSVAEVLAADVAVGEEALEALRVAEAAQVAAEDQPIKTAENSTDE